MPAAKRRKKAGSRTVTPPREELARYIADRSAELALLAGRARWPLLTYLLNMARIEAETRASGAAVVTSEGRTLPKAQSS